MSKPSLVENDPYDDAAGETDLSELGTDQQLVNFTFAPVDDAVILELIGYVTLGLSDYFDPGKRTVKKFDSIYVTNVIYKWHVWLNRMNAWLSENAQIYPKYLAMTEVRLPGNLYFMGDSPPKGSATNIDAFLNSVRNAGLGPLLPTEFEQLRRALVDGINKAHSENFETASYQRTLLTEWLRGVNHVASYAVTPSLSAESGALQVTPASITIPVPPTTKYVSTGSNTLIERFTDVAQNTPKKKWMIILLAAILIYMIFKDTNTTQYGGQVLRNFELPAALRVR